MDAIALAIPVFFLLIGVELIVAHGQGKRVYRLNDTLNDLSCGILQQVLGVFAKVVVLGGYVAVYERWRVASLDGGAVWVWVACFLAVDWAYYVFHRVSHESNLPWGAHIVHHQSEEYNLAVALRQGAFQPLFSWVFYLPLAWLGFPPLVFVACSSANTLYQFWIHTRTIGRLGPLEWFLNTPSHHRVHHGCDAKYIDRNYGGVLIVWDRLFGTFQREEEEPTYGITKPLASWNPLWANLHYYRDLLAWSRRAPTWREKVKVWLEPPAWRPAWSPEGIAPKPAVHPLSHGEAGKFDRDAPRGLKAYAVAQFVVAVAATVVLLYFASRFGLAVRLLIAALVGWTVLDVGALFEGRRWAAVSELARLLAFPAAVAVVARGLAFPAAAGASYTAVAAALVSALFAAWLLRHRAARTAQ